VIDRILGQAGGEKVGRGEMGERLGGFIYGTIVVLATLIAGARAYSHGIGHVALLVFLTTVVFWLAHVYADSLADSIRRSQRLSWHEVVEIARRESSIIEAAVTPVLLLILGKIGLFSENTAVWLAFAAGLVVLGAGGVAFARTTRLGRIGTLLIVGLNVSIGLVLVGLKLFVGHH